MYVIRFRFFISVYLLFSVISVKGAYASGYAVLAGTAVGTVVLAFWK